MLGGVQSPPTIFSQINSPLHPEEFSRCVQAFPTPRVTRGLSEYDQFLALCFGQLTHRESLRDIVTCLRARGPSLYHLGFRGYITRTNLAYANQHRDWRLFAAVAQVLMRRAARLYQNEPWDPDLPQVAFALDSSIIRLSLNLCPWGYWARTGHAALKLHLMLSLQGNVPAWGAITEASLPDLKMLDRIPILAGAHYILDRGYLDFPRLFGVDQGDAFFVVRSKHHVRFAVIESRPVDKATGLRCDQMIRLTSRWSERAYPKPLRRIRFYNAEHQITLVLLTNNLELDAWVIAELYRNRWQVELFFKWIKQHLRVRGFYGRSQNAVCCQIWSAICAYLMVAIMKKELGVQKSLYEILQIVSVNAFEQVPLQQLLTDATPNAPADDRQKLLIFND
jgi:transposase